MKETIFYININLKTAEGLDTFGKFFVGNNRNLATGLFSQLKGTTDVDAATVISLELMETRKNLPFNMLMKSCTLEQLADNCKTITREFFKHFNLDPGQP